MIIGQQEFKSLLGGGNSVEIKYAKIAEGYSGGRPALVFDGESTPTIKRYPYLAWYTPTSGDRVVVINGLIYGNII